MTRLLAADEPAPVTIEREHGESPLFLFCDHAVNRIPAALGSLGLAPEHLQRHIAWDIGVAGVSRHLSAMLDATLVLQNYSRLVVDCNRPRDHATLIATHSEDTAIPGNHDLSAAERERRIETIFAPYHEAITRLLDARGERPTAIAAIHSFTPVYHDVARPWHVGILYGRDRRMAASMLASLAAEPGLCVGDNEPYRIDEKDYGIPFHGEARGLPHVLVEIRQDLIADAAGQREWAERLRGPLEAAFAAVFPDRR